MSDFDKEAEREKLREKYEKDQQRRETTEKMSELLLQGATMTNSHCADCGDPIFRYDGQEFCPTCERPVSGGEDASEDDAADDDQGTIRVTEPQDDARVKFGGESAEESQANPEMSQPADHARQPVDDQQGQLDSTAGQSGGEQPQQTGRAETQSIPSSDPARSPGTTPSSGTDRPADTADVAAARDSLVRTLTKFSQQAEATDDPQRARDSLAAAREAAETLAALRR